MCILSSLSLCIKKKCIMGSRKKKKETPVQATGLIDKPVLDTLISPFLLPAGDGHRVKEGNYIVHFIGEKDV